MAQQERVVILDGIEHHFPGSATDTQISAALGAIPATNAPLAPKARTWSEPSDSGGVGLALAGKVVPGAVQVASGIATSPTLPATAAKVGRVMGGIAPIVTGAKTGGPVGALAGIAASAKGAWAGGKTGYFTGKMVQGMAAPIAKVLESVAPYAQTLATLGGVQGGLDLAQMAEPNRKDIGFLGIGLGDPQTPEEAKAHPPLLNLAYAKVAEAVKYLMDQGLKQSEAVRAVMNAKAQGGSVDRSQWDKRADGSAKGDGFLGILQRPDGKVSSEISIGVNINGKEVEIPTMVPTLSQQEVQWLLMNDVSDPSKIPQSIIQKAVAFAQPRIAAGKSPFAGPDESPKRTR